MHFATFAGGEYEALEPLVRLVVGRERLLGGDGDGGVGRKGRGKEDWEEERGLVLLMLEVGVLFGLASRDIDELVYLGDVCLPCCHVVSFWFPLLSLVPP
jgi:hypothetical protein